MESPDTEEYQKRIIHRPTAGGTGTGKLMRTRASYVQPSMHSLGAHRGSRARRRSLAQLAEQADSSLLSAGPLVEALSHAVLDGDHLGLRVSLRGGLVRAMAVVEAQRIARRVGEHQVDEHGVHRLAVEHVLRVHAERCQVVLHLRQNTPRATHGTRA